MIAKFNGRDAKFGSEFEAGVEIEKSEGGYTLIFQDEDTEYKMKNVTVSGKEALISRVWGSRMVVVSGLNEKAQRHEMHATNASELHACALRFSTICRADRNVVNNRDYTLQMAREDFEMIMNQVRPF